MARNPAQFEHFEKRPGGLSSIKTSIEIAATYRGVADFLLLDSWDPGTRQSAALGRTHDWSLNRHNVENICIPAILAGGLGPENVAEAIAVIRPPGADSKTRTDRFPD